MLDSTTPDRETEQRERATDIVPSFLPSIALHLRLRILLISYLLIAPGKKAGPVFGARVLLFPSPSELFYVFFVQTYF